MLYNHHDLLGRAIHDWYKFCWTSDTARMEYHMSRTLAVFAFVTMYLLGQTLGGIVCSPISETFGRRTLYIVSSAVFCIFSIVTAAPPSSIAVYFGRFFQGIAAAVPACVAYGSLEDMWAAQTRIWVVYWYTVSGFIGLVLGPIYSSYITHYYGWRAVFYISAVAAGISTILSFFMKETKATQLLQKKVDVIHSKTGRDDLNGPSSGGFSFKSFAMDSLFRPLQFLVTEPIVFFCSALCAIAFGLIYGLTEGLTVAYTNPPFDQTFSMTSSSLSFIAILIGILLDVLPRFYDDYLFNRFRKEKRRLLPETKIRSFALACPALAIGLWIFAWTIPPRVANVHWVVSMIGLVFIGFATADLSYVLFGYCTDAYGPMAASAVSSLSTCRTIAAAVFPLFAYQMFSGLGANVAASILAAVATLFAFTPILFLKYGRTLRKKSKVAAADEDCLAEENKHMDDDSGEGEKEKKTENV
ncbi:MFS general substrate transporter [Aureobasidium sp. EXF-10728]|nr:MFS general substrate transporter [Aureobasidium sp. EXF-10728]